MPENITETLSQTAKRILRKKEAAARVNFHIVHMMRKSNDPNDDFPAAIKLGLMAKDPPRPTRRSAGRESRSRYSGAPSTCSQMFPRNLPWNCRLIPTLPNGNGR